MSDARRLNEVVCLKSMWCNAELARRQRKQLGKLDNYAKKTGNSQNF